MTVAINVSIWQRHASAQGLLCLLACLAAASAYQQAPMRSASSFTPQQCCGKWPGRWATFFVLGAVLLCGVTRRAMQANTAAPDVVGLPCALQLHGTASLPTHLEQTPLAKYLERQAGCYKSTWPADPKACDKDSEPLVVLVVSTGTALDTTLLGLFRLRHPSRWRALLALTKEEEESLSPLAVAILRRARGHITCVQQPVPDRSTSAMTRLAYVEKLSPQVPWAALLDSGETLPLEYVSLLQKDAQTGAEAIVSRVWWGPATAGVRHAETSVPAQCRLGVHLQLRVTLARRHQLNALAYSDLQQLEVAELRLRARPQIGRFLSRVNCNGMPRLDSTSPMQHLASMVTAHSRAERGNASWLPVPGCRLPAIVPWSQRQWWSQWWSKRLAPNAAADKTDVRVSVLLPTMGRPVLLMQAVRSFMQLANAPRRVEVCLIVDDGDLPTAAAAQQLQAEYGSAYVRVLTPSVARLGYFGFFKRLNEAARASRGRLLLFADDDMVMTTPNWDDALDAQCNDRLAICYMTEQNCWGWCHPIMTRALFELIGHFTAGSVTDAYLRTLASYAQIEKRVSTVMVRELQCCELAGLPEPKRCAGGDPLSPMHPMNNPTKKAITNKYLEGEADSICQALKKIVNNTDYVQLSHSRSRYSHIEANKGPCRLRS